MKSNLLIATSLLCLIVSVRGEIADCQNDTDEINLKYELYQNDKSTDTQATSDERFLAVPVNQMGVDELDPENSLIAEIVQPFLPNDCSYLYALNATREIVNGVKYEIVFVMQNEADSDVVCLMDVLEKPWLVRDKRKFRKMTYNNCSLMNPVDGDDGIRQQYDINPVFTNQQSYLTEDDIIKDMEDQIITEKSTVITTTTEEDDATLAPLNPSSKNLLDDFFNMNHFFPPPPSSTTTTTTLSPLSNSGMDALDEIFGMKKVENTQSALTIGDDDLQQSRIEPNEALPTSKESTALKELEMEIKKAFSELFQTDPDFQMNIIALINRKDDSAAQKNYNYVVSILAAKLKDKIESYSDRRTEAHNQQVTVNPNDQQPGDIRRKRKAGLWNLAELALEQLDRYDNDNKKRILLDILDVGKNEKDNNLFTITVTIANSRCSEKSENCNDILDNKTKKICLLEVSGNDGDLVKSQCSPLADHPHLLGAPSSIDVDDEDIQLFLNEALTEINASEEPDYVVKKVLQATRQVVSGFLYKFKVEVKSGDNDVICDFEVWEQSWLENGRDVKVHCDNRKLYSFSQNPVAQREKARNKRQVPGAPRPTDVTDENVLLYLNEALAEINEKEEPDYSLKQVVEASKQIVKGSLTRIKAILLAGNDEVTCDFEVWEQIWLENGRDVKVNCDNRKIYKLTQNPVVQRGNTRNKRQHPPPGSESETDVNDKNVLLYLDEALAEINAKEEPDYSLKKVLKATEQSVAGLLTKIKAILLVGNDEVTCDFEILEQSWLQNGRDVKVNCDNHKIYKLTQNPVGQRGETRNKRQLPPGTPTEIDKNDAFVNNLLRTHLQRLDTGSESPMELISIEKITLQIAAGNKYTVKGTFKAADDIKKCNVDILSRPWIKGDDGTQIKAECEDGLRLKAKKRNKRSVQHRPMPEQHDRHHHGRQTSEMKMRTIKSEILFEHYIKKYNRKYLDDEEYEMRHRIFKKNLHKIEMLNKNEQGTAKYGITPFADLTEKEYFHKTGLVIREHQDNEIRNPIAEIPDIELPEEFDWRDKGAITSVKNQGNCGSCWSFSVTGNIEGLHAIKTGKLESYSEQELLDCDTKDSACNGGYMDDAFNAIEQIGGLELEEDYPYLAKKQNKCQFNSTKVHVKVKGVVDLPKGDEVAMQKYLVANGPVSIGINAAAMQFYRGGVSHPWKILCRKSDLDHGVLLVGFGKKEYPMFNKTLPYWTIKNSWGPKWGEQGFYRIYRGDNSCGVAQMASSAVLE